MAEARDLYEQASVAAEEQRWADAIGLFEQSYSLSGASVALFSLGYTFRAVGRFREARDVFDQLLASEEIDDELTQQARNLRREVAAKVAVLRLVGLDEYPESQVLLDGTEAQDTGQRPLDVEVDPGSHAIRVEAEGYSAYMWEGRMAPGRNLTLDIELASDGSSIWESPWLWAGVGVVVVLATIITIVVLQSNAQLSPNTEFHLKL